MSGIFLSLSVRSTFPSPRPPFARCALHAISGLECDYPNDRNFETKTYKTASHLMHAVVLAGELAAFISSEFANS
jgi:hypothetical protein